MAFSQRSSQVSGPVGEVTPAERRKFFLFRKCFMAAILLFAALLATVIFFAERDGNIVPDPAKWQAVFLNNGQVYFGHLDKARNDYLGLTNVYYLRASQALQPAASTTTPSFELVKLGGEMHGPEDAIYFEKSAVMFWENMRPDSQVVQAISNFQKNLKQ
jgi:hypothetical protein